MVDSTAQTPAVGQFDHGSLKVTSPRLKKRWAAEFRLKLYGILALSAAAFALVALLGSVVINASKALTETYVTSEVTIDPEVIGVTADAPPEEIGRAEFGNLVDEMIEAKFPMASGRSAKRELDELISGGASFELADKVAANPSLIGETVTFDFLASDTTDLYLKGEFGALSDEGAEGLLSVSEGEDGTLTLSTSSNDFTEALKQVKTHLYEVAESLRTKADRQQNAVEVYTQRAEAAETEDDRQRQLDSAERARDNRDELLAEADMLEERAAGASGAEQVDDDNISILINAGGGWLRLTEVNRASGKAEMLTRVDLPIENSSDWTLYTSALPESERAISDRQIAWIETLKADGKTESVFNTRLFTAADSRAPELAGIKGALIGSLWTMLVTFSLAFPIGVLGAIYLEEFAPKNRFTNFIEVNINNLAAVPSIVFGLLGLAVFINVVGVPRSAPLAGGIVLALMTLPTIIIASRAAIRAVPPSIRDAALGVGASNTQASFHHVLPLAMPGILTGTIIGMAQALGETAPLIMIGMVAFIVDAPTGITDSATVLPVQVFRWSDFPERAFEAKTAAAICVLLIFLVLMNLIAIILRRRFERRW